MTTKQLGNDFIGTSLSWGTMRPIDLYNAFMPFLEEYDAETAQEIKKEYADIVDRMEEAQEEGKIYWHDYIEDEEFLIEALFDALGDIAPDDCYFGAHPGDGSDYGFWQHEEEYSLE